MKPKSLFLTPNDIAVIGCRIFAKPNGYANKTTRRLDKEICQSMIGTSFEVSCEIWNLIQVCIEEVPDFLEEKLAEELKQYGLSFATFITSIKPDYLLWALVLLKNYSTEEVNARLVGGTDVKTYQKWSWLLVKSISAPKDFLILQFYQQK